MSVHPLAGVVVKLRNADHHLQRLYDATGAYLKGGPKPSGPAGIVAEHYPRDSTRGLLRFKVLREPPLEVAAMAGDVIHNLRCSLDYVVEEMVKRNGKKPGLSHQFPICTSSDGFKDAQRRGRLNGISKSGIAAIEQLQPYKVQAKGGAIAPLLLLHKLSNRDKHHMLAICALNANLVWSFVGRNGQVLRSDRTTEPVRDGGVLAEMPSNMVIDGQKTQLQAQVTLTIGFNEPTLSPFAVFGNLAGHPRVHRQGYCPHV